MSNVIDPAAPEAGGARRGRRALLVLGALVTAGLLVYLTYALVRPERF